MSSVPCFRLTMRRLALLLVLLTCLGVCFPVSTPAHAAEQGVAQGGTDTDPQPIVFIGFTGVRWDDINEKDTPNLFAFTQKAAGANLVTKTFDETTCPMRGWFTVGTGVRMTGDCAPIDVTSEGRIAQWDSYIADNAKNSYKPVFGLLGQSLSESLGSEAILALGSGAGLALADSEGVVAGRYVDTIRVGDTPELNAERVDVNEGLAQIDDATRLVFVDLGQVRNRDDDAEGAHGGSEGAKAIFTLGDTELTDEARADLSDIDQTFGQAIQRVQADMPHARILVASLGDSQSLRGELSFFAARGLSGEETAAFVSSDSTRNRGLIQNIDITASLIAWLAPRSEAAQSISGSPIFVGASTDSLADALVGEQNRARLSRVLVGPFYGVFFGGTIIVAFAAWAMMRRRSQQDSRLDKPRKYLAFTALIVASLPVAALVVNCVSWWNLSHPRLAFFAIVGAIAVCLAGVSTWVAARGKPSLSVAFIACVTAGVIAADLVVNSFVSHSLQFPSMWGASPQVGGRFYGLSNTAFAIFVTAVLIELVVFAVALVGRGKRTQASVLIIVCGLLALIVDGLAIFGTDFGGPPALTLGLGLLFLTVMDKKLTLLRALLLCVAAACTSIVFALLDYVNPASQRSHLGRFIQSVHDGNLLSILSRKIMAATFGLPVPLVLVFILACIGLVVWLWKRWRSKGFSWRGFFARLTPEFSSEATESVQCEGGAKGALYGEREALSAIRYSLPALALTLIGAAFINDSSVMIPIAGGALALMLYVSVLVRAR